MQAARWILATGGHQRGESCHGWDLQALKRYVVYLITYYLPKVGTYLVGKLTRQREGRKVCYEMCLECLASLSRASLTRSCDT